MLPLDNVPTEVLAEELCRRGDLRKPNGLLSRELYSLRTKLGCISTVDGVPVRVTDGKIEGGLILRNTGYYSGKWCLVGGVVGYKEDIESALKRQFLNDLGVSVDLLTTGGVLQPVMVAQYCPPPIPTESLSMFLPEVDKHSLGTTFLVRIVRGSIKYGQTKYGGQEARGFGWFSKGNIPSPDMFGYGMRVVFEACLRMAERFV